MTIALEVCRLAQDYLGPERVPQLVAVGIEIGDDAGVEPDSLGFCLEALLDSPPFHHARPELVRQPGDALRVAYLKVDDAV